MDSRTGPILCLEKRDRNWELLHRNCRVRPLWPSAPYIMLFLLYRRAFMNVCQMRTATRAAPCKRTAQHLVTGRYIRDSNWKLHHDSRFLRFFFVSAPRFDEGESAICGLRAVRGVPLINPQTENGKEPQPLALTQRGFLGFGSKTLNYGPSKLLQICNQRRRLTSDPRKISTVLKKTYLCKQDFQFGYHGCDPTESQIEEKLNFLTSNEVIYRKTS